MRAIDGDELIDGHEVVVATHDLTRWYGRHRGVEGLDLELRRSEIFGYLGPNGAGKTTTIRLLLDLIRPTRGTASLFGLDARRDSLEIRRRVGYVPGELTLYESLTGVELVEYFGRLRGGVDHDRVRALADRLDCDLRRPIRTLSHGNRQKVGLIQAFMNRPELLILDEPSQGLDPLIQREFYRLLGEVRTDGATVFLSSHNLTEVERTCDRVGIIREGRLLAVEDVQRLRANALRRLELHFGAPPPTAVFQGLPGIRDLELDGTVLRCTVVGSVDALLKAASRFEVVNVISQEPSLEEVFLAYYGAAAVDGMAPERRAEGQIRAA